MTTNDFSCDEQTTEHFPAPAADGGDPIGSSGIFYLRGGEDQAVNVPRDVLGAKAAL